MIKLPPDITFVIQLVGFVVFWQLMRVLLFTPMQEALKKRTERTGGARTRAEAFVSNASESMLASTAIVRPNGAVKPAGGTSARRRRTINAMQPAM